MPDLSHARNAKARGAQQFAAGRITRAQLEKIDRKADRIIKACAPKNNPHPKGKPMDTAIAKRSGNPHNPEPMKMWPWVLGGVFGVGAVALGGWFWWSRKKVEPTFPGVSDTPAPPDGYETTTCQQYRGHTLCAVKQLTGMPKWFAWTYDGGAPNGKFALPQLAMAAAKAFMDSLEAEPLPDVNGTPAATTEGADSTAGLEEGAFARGITMQFGPTGECETFSVNDLGKWLTWASTRLASLNVGAWSSVELMDNVWKQAFSVCGDKLSEVAGVTIAGQPYADIVSSGQAFLDSWKGEVIQLQPGETPQRIFAGRMIGQAHVPPAPTVDDPTKIPQFAIGPSAQLLQLESTTGVVWTVALLPQSQYEPAAGAHVFSVPWYAWSLGTELKLSKAQHGGSSESAEKSLEEATAAVG